jgi:hypothetical protein
LGQLWKPIVQRLGEHRELRHQLQGSVKLHALLQSIVTGLIGWSWHGAAFSSVIGRWRSPVIAPSEKLHSAKTPIPARKILQNTCCVTWEMSVKGNNSQEFGAANAVKR